MNATIGRVLADKGEWQCTHVLVTGNLGYIGVVLTPKLVRRVMTYWAWTLDTFKSATLASFQTVIIDRSIKTFEILSQMTCGELMRSSTWLPFPTTPRAS